MSFLEGECNRLVSPGESSVLDRSKAEGWGAKKSNQSNWTSKRTTRRGCQEVLTTPSFEHRKTWDLVP